MMKSFKGNCKSGSYFSSDRPILFVKKGESNSGGKALNIEASEVEMSNRLSCKILNNDTLLFEDLQIGVNNLIGHVGFDASIKANCHGWELELANLADANYFRQKPIYIVATGAGGSVIDEWDATDPYYTTMLTRVNAAKSLIFAETGKHPIIFILYSQGINDQYTGHTAAEWKPKTIAHFAQMRSDIGNWPIIMTSFDDMPMDETFITAIKEICNEVSDCYKIDVHNLKSDGSLHWDYKSMKCIADAMAFVAIDRNRFNDVGAVICDGITGKYRLAYPEIILNRFREIKSQAYAIDTGSYYLKSTQLNARAANCVDNRLTDKKNFLVVREIVNDLKAGASVETAHANFKNYCLARKAAAISAGKDLQVIVMTSPQRSDLEDDLIRQSNDLIFANWKSYSDGFIDLRSDVRLQTISSNYYGADNNNMNHYGNEIIAGMVLEKIKTLL